MRKLYLRLVVACLTFLLGISATAVWLFYPDAPSKSDLNEHVSPAVSKPNEVPRVSLQLCSEQHEKNRIIDASEAIQRAECFVLENGYTDLPASEDRSKLKPEAISPLTGDRGMERRRNSLEPRAYGFKRGFRDEDDWVVVFRMKYQQSIADAFPNYREYITKHGRKVTMKANGSNLQMEHQDISLDSSELEIINH